VATEAIAEDALELTVHPVDSLDRLVTAKPAHKSTFLLRELVIDEDAAAERGLQTIHTCL
jgi:hypothetical protein